MIKKIALLLFGIVFFSAILTPITCDILIYFNGGLPFPFSRVFDRVALGVAIILLILLRKSLGFSGFKSFVQVERARLKEGLVGFLVALTGGVLTIAYYMYQGDVLLNQSGMLHSLKKTALVIPVAFLIAFIEEVFFRGVLLRTMTQRVGWLAAMVGSSLLYSVVHFIAPVKEFSYSAGDWLGGFAYIKLVCSNILSYQELPGVFGLWLVGMVLADLALWRKSLSCSIGVHAGWIVALKGLVYFTTFSPNLYIPTALARRYFIVGQLPGWICVLAAFVVIRIILGRISHLPNSNYLVNPAKSTVEP